MMSRQRLWPSLLRSGNVNPSRKIHDALLASPDPSISSRRQLAYSDCVHVPEDDGQSGAAPHRDAVDTLGGLQQTIGMSSIPQTRQSSAFRLVQVPRCERRSCISVPRAWTRSSSSHLERRKCRFVCTRINEDRRSSDLIYCRPRLCVCGVTTGRSLLCVCAGHNYGRHGSSSARTGRRSHPGFELALMAASR